MSEIIDSEARNRSLSENSDTEYEPQFKPIVNLPEVEVTTNEEDETVLLKLRAKLYRFDKTSEPAEWKERGTGEMKILQHNEKQSVRIVMRRDKTYKICANHFIMPWMVLKPCSGSEKAFVYTVPADFADEEIKTECLAIKFGTVENANSFKCKFEEAKTFVGKKGTNNNNKCDENKSDSTTEEVTDKLLKLQVNEQQRDEKSQSEVRCNFSLL